MLMLFYLCILKIIDDILFMYFINVDFYQLFTYLGIVFTFQKFYVSISLKISPSLRLIG